MSLSSAVQTAEWSSTITWMGKKKDGKTVPNTHALYVCTHTHDTHMFFCADVAPTELSDLQVCSHLRQL